MSLALDNLHVFDERKSPESYIDPSTAGFSFDPLSSIDMLHYTGESYGMPSAFFPFAATADQVLIFTIFSFVA